MWKYEEKKQRALIKNNQVSLLSLSFSKNVFFLLLLYARQSTVV